MSKVTNFTVHKNNREQRQAKLRRKDLEHTAKRQGRDTVMLDGYCLVTWDREGEANVNWACGDMNTSNLPEYIKNSLQRAIGIRDKE